MTARKIALFLTITLLITLSATFLSAQSPATEEDTVQVESSHERCDWRCQLREKQAQQLEGSWDVTVTPAVPPGVPQPPSFIAHATFARGGAAFGSDRTRPTSKQHGAWTHIRGNQFVWTTTEDLFDSMGNFSGTIKIRVKVTITDNDAFVGVSNGEQRDANGNLIFNRCGTVRGTRIKIEPLAEQCQNITPPR